MKNSDLVNLHNLSIKELLTFKRYNLGQKHHFYKLIKECELIDKQIEKKLAVDCNHQWKFYPATQMYERSTRTCTICNLDKRDVRYMNSNMNTN